MEDKILKLQEELQGVPCPICHHVDWDLLLRCDLEFGGCLYESKCRHCNYAMEVSEGARDIYQKEPGLEARMKDARCPNCGSQKSSLIYRCDLKSKECNYIAECGDCHRHFRLNEKIQTIP